MPLQTSSSDPDVEAILDDFRRWRNPGVSRAQVTNADVTIIRLLALIAARLGEGRSE